MRKNVACCALGAVSLLPFSAHPVPTGPGLVTGTAAGIVVTQGGALIREGTSVVTGPSSQSFTANGNVVQGAANFGINQAESHSNGVTDTYAAAYWGDVITFTGGVGAIDVGISMSVDGTFSASGMGVVSDSAMRWRMYGDPAYFLGAPDNQLLDLLTLDFYDNINVEPNSPMGGADLALEAIFDNGAFVECLSVGPVDADSFSCQTIGIGFGWSYGVPLNIGFLLETWASNGASADFYDTGNFAGFTLPAGTSVSSASGTAYAVNGIIPQVPEPITLLLVATGVVGLAPIVRRRREKETT